MKTVAQMQTLLDTALGKLGLTATFTSASNSYNPATGANTETETEYTAKCSPASPYRQDLIDGTNVKQNDAEVTISAKDAEFTPAPQMKVVLASETWRIVTVRPLNYRDGVIGWEAQLRR